MTDIEHQKDIFRANAVGRQAENEFMEQNYGLTVEEVRLLYMYSLGVRTMEIAKELGVTARTVNNKLREPRLRKAYKHISLEIWEKAMMLLSGTAEDCVRALRKIINDEKISPMVKVKAATTVFSTLNTYFESIEENDTEEMRRSVLELKEYVEKNSRKR